MSFTMRIDNLLDNRHKAAPTVEIDLSHEVACVLDEGIAFTVGAEIKNTSLEPIELREIEIILRSGLTWKEIDRSKYSWDIGEYIIEPGRAFYDNDVFVAKPGIPHMVYLYVTSYGPTCGNCWVAREAIELERGAS